MINIRGYSILKSSINDKEKLDIMNELTIKPIENILNGKNKIEDDNSFPIWRENSTKFYVPRFFGLKKWGIPSTINLPHGDIINIDFNGELRPIQIPIVSKTLNYFHEKGNTGEGGALLELYCAIGKTVCALNIISKLKRKTIIIVHKEFLMNQWIERAKEFLPGVRIGKIQGSLFDIENKDIVIGMVQSMYNRNYSLKDFDSFGFSIFDEVHRFGSRQFSNIFWKFSTYYMLGITATINRKDGTTPLLTLFIGPIIYTITDRGKESVIVLGIVFTDNDGIDAPYLKQETDFRGNVKYSTMISNICNHKPRTLGIFKIICNILEKYPTSQIMILAHNLCLLNDMENIILEKYPTLSYGFYVGGMKKKDLINTEIKTIVLATYAMAQEALDIKKLNVLILCSSKTDIVQSVGRILRDKNTERKIIIDIIDPNPTFQNQWQKRLKYYKKCDYHVYKINKWEDYLKKPYYPFDDNYNYKSCWKKIHPKINIDKHDYSSDDNSDIKNSNISSSKKCMIVF